MVGRELRVRSVEVGGSAGNERSLEIRLGGRQASWRATGQSELSPT